MAGAFHIVLVSIAASTVCCSNVIDPSHPISHHEVRKAFERFKAYHSRDYADDDEEEQRFDNFRLSLDLVRAQNAKAGRSWDMGINQFSDMSDAEFQKLVLMSSQDCSATSARPKVADSGAPDMVLPEGMDWRERGVVSEVKNQGHCGSCWTFSSTGCLEAHLAIKFGDTWHATRLSEQQLVDCAQAFDNHGCEGGLPSHAFEYIQAAGGLSTEFYYPYSAKDQPCAFHGVNGSLANQDSQAFEPTSAGVGVKVPGGSVNLTAGDEGSLKQVLATKGPVSIAFQVASDFRHYSKGVYTSEVCKSGPKDVNHAVLAIGYGTDPESGKPYWLIKNSWDYSWGDEGFFKMEAFKNMCGVADCMAYPDLYAAGEDRPSLLV